MACSAEPAQSPSRSGKGDFKNIVPDWVETKFHSFSISFSGLASQTRENLSFRYLCGVGKQKQIEPQLSSRQGSVQSVVAASAIFQHVTISGRSLLRERCGAARKAPGRSHICVGVRSYSGRNCFWAFAIGIRLAQSRVQADTSHLWTT